MCTKNTVLYSNHILRLELLYRLSPMSFTSNSVAAILFAPALLNTMSTDPQDLMQSDWSAGLFVYSHAPVLSHGTFNRPLWN